MSQWQCAHGVWHSHFDRVDPCKDCRQEFSNLIKGITVPTDEQNEQRAIVYEENPNE